MTVSRHHTDPMPWRIDVTVHCPDCDGEQVLRLDPTYHPDRWRCLTCHVDYLEGDQKGTPDDSVLVFRYPGIPRRGRGRSW